MDILVQKILLVAKQAAKKKKQSSIKMKELGAAILDMDQCRAEIEKHLQMDARDLPLWSGEISETHDMEIEDRQGGTLLSDEVREAVAQADAGKDLGLLIRKILLSPNAGIIPVDHEVFKSCSVSLKRKLDLQDEDAVLQTFSILATQDLLKKLDSSPTLVKKIFQQKAMQMTKQPKLNLPVKTKDDEKEVLSTEPETVEPEAADDMLSLIRRVSGIKQTLQEDVFGQEDAIEAVCDGLLKQGYRTKPELPAGIFTFIGASATGKTLLASKLDKVLGEDWKSISVQMETMQHENAGHEINGLDQSYRNASPGNVTGFVRQNPKSVVIFENFDKAHANARSIVEPLFTTGQLVDQHGFYELESDGSYDYSEKIAEPEVSFNQAIVIFTSTAGEDAYESPAFEKLLTENPQQVEAVLLKELTRSKQNRQEYAKEKNNSISSSFSSGLSLGRVAYFKKMSFEILTQCAQNGVEQAIVRLEEALGVKIACHQHRLIAQVLLLSDSPNVSALSASEGLAEKFIDPLLDYLRDGKGDVPKDILLQFGVGKKKKFEGILAGFKDKDPVSEMFRKSQTIKLEINAVAKKQSLVLQISSIELQKVSHAHDFSGAGSLQAEMPEVSFQDIAGHHAVKKRMHEIVKILKSPDYIKGLGVDVPKGLLLFGKPGTGKTLLAKALAHEADLPFISTTGSELLNLEFIKEVFKRARKYAPSILFIDEIDAVGKRNGGNIDIIINQLLTEIDGFETSFSAPVFVVAATNLPEKIDAAILRSGRIDLHVDVPMLDRDARQYFIQKYLELPHDDSLDQSLLLNYTSGMTGADLEKVQRETVLEMVSLDKEKISMDMLTEQINTIKYGVRSTHPKLLQNLEMTAYHEAGHAIVSMVLNPDILIEQVTVAPRKNALGFVSFDQESAQYRQRNRKEVLDKMSVLLAGRVSQTRQFPAFGDDEGASSDLEKANSLAVEAITLLGLDEEVGNLVRPSVVPKDILFKRTQVWLKEAEVQCMETIEKHWDDIDALAKYLIEKEVVTGAELRERFTVN